jgi:hypothetical protein
MACLDSDKIGQAYTDKYEGCGDSYQAWTHAASGSTAYVIRDFKTGLCLVSASGGKVNKVTMAKCNYSSLDQQWSWQNTGTRYYHLYWIENIGTGYYLDSNSSGHVYTDGWNDGPYQVWNTLNVGQTG